MSTLLQGAGGFPGLNTVDAFKMRQLPLLCGWRKSSNVLGLRQRGATLLEVDLDQPETIVLAIQGLHHAIHLAGHYPPLSNTPEKTLETGLRQTLQRRQRGVHSGADDCQATRRRLLSLWREFIQTKDTTSSGIWQSEPFSFDALIQACRLG